MSANTFSQDLKSLREQKGISLNTIIDKTGIQSDILEQLESGELFTNKRFNNIYVEAISKSYASVLGISQGDALTAAKETLAGTYRGLIGTTYNEKTAEKSVEPKKNKKAEAKVVAIEEVKEEVKEEVNQVVTETPKPFTPITFEDEINTDITAVEPITEEKSFGTRLAEARRDSGFGSGYDNESNGIMKVVGALGALAVLIGLCYFGYNYYQSTLNTTQTAPTDSPTLTQAPAVEKITLPDSLKIEIMANTVAQAGIKITNDGFTRARIDSAGKNIEPTFTFKRKNLAAPAWIEKGEGIRIFTKDSLRIDGATNVQIKVEGKVWNYTPAPSLVLTRKMAEDL